MDFQQRVWLVIHNIPKGKVASYGQVAEWAGKPRGARQVGRILSQLPPDSQLPWHRVVNRTGHLRTSGASAREQRQKLQAEGVIIHGDQVAAVHRMPHL